MLKTPNSLLMTYLTSSSAVAERPLDALCPSVGLLSTYS